MKKKTFKLHWLTGQSEVVNGYDIADAFSKAGYGAGAVRALDWYEEIKGQVEVRDRPVFHDIL
jgi:flavin-binding protein dodecin